MIGEGLAVPLLAVAADFPELAFDPPTARDSFDLGIEADLMPRSGGVGTRVKVFIRRRKLQVELRPRRKAQWEWMRSYFSCLGADRLRRKDDVLFPDARRCPRNMTDDLHEVAHRVRIIHGIVNAEDVGVPRTARGSEFAPGEARRGRDHYYRSLCSVLTSLMWGCWLGARSGSTRPWARRSGSARD